MPCFQQTDIFPFIVEILVKLSTHLLRSLNTATANILVDDMDKQLLLSLQSVCNEKGIKLPWDEVGESMEKQVSGGAIIQHIAKIRQRLAAGGFSVPPPLRRGGGNGNPASASQDIRTTPVPRHRRGNVSSASVSRDSGFFSPPRRGNGIRTSTSDAPRAYYPDNEFGSRITRQNDPRARRGNPSADQVENDETTPEYDDTTIRAGNKRKRGINPSGPLKQSAGLAGRIIHQRKTGKESRGASSNVSDNSENDLYGDKSQTDSDDCDEQASVGQRYLAVGAGFLADYDYDDNSASNETDSKEAKAAKTVTVLQIGKSERAVSLLQDLQGQAAGAVDLEAVPYLLTSSMSGFDGGGELVTYGFEARPKVADVVFDAGTSRVSAKSTQGFGQQFPQAPLSYENSSLVINNGPASLALGTNTFYGGKSAIYDSSDFQSYTFRSSGHQEFDSTPADVISAAFTAPVGCSSQQIRSASFSSPYFHPSGPDIKAADRFRQASGWSAPSAISRNESQQSHGAFSLPLDNYNQKAHRGISLPDNSPEGDSTVNLDNNNLAIRQNQSYVAPADLLGSNFDTVPNSLKNSSSQTQGLSRVSMQPFQSSTASDGTFSAEINSEIVPGWNSLSPHNDGTVQFSNIESSDNMTWTDFVADFDGTEDILGTNLGTVHSSPDLRDTIFEE